MPTGSPLLPSLSSRPRATDGAGSTSTFLFSTRVATFMASKTSCTRRRAGDGMDCMARSGSMSRFLVVRAAALQGSVAFDDHGGVGVGAAGEQEARLAFGLAQAVRFAHHHAAVRAADLAGGASAHRAAVGQVDAGLEAG